MTRIDKLIKKICFEPVEYKPLWSIAIWDKRFSGVKKEKQPKVNTYKYYLSSEFDKVERPEGKIIYIPTGISGKNRYTTEQLAGKYLSEGEVIFIPGGGTPNVKYYKGKFVTGDNRIATSIDTKLLSNKFLYYWMQNNIDIISSFYRGSGIKHPNMKSLLDLKCPVPTIEVQNEIVKILDTFSELITELTQELTARKQQYEYYRDKIFKNQNAKITKLGDIGQVRMCKRIMKHQTNSISGVPFYKIGTFGRKPDAYISEETYKEYVDKYNYPKKGDILISCSGTIGRTIVYDGKPAYYQDSNIVWLEHDSSKVLNEYLIYCYELKPWKISTGGTIARLYNDNILNAQIPLPSIDEQKVIVETLDKFKKLCNDISQGLPAEIEARQKQYEYYRDKLLNFKQLKSV